MGGWRDGVEGNRDYFVDGDNGVITDCIYRLGSHAQAFARSDDAMNEWKNSFGRVKYVKKKV